MKNQISAAEEYRRRREQKRLAELETIPEAELFDVEVPSGMIFKCRKPDFKSYIISGVLPTSLTETLMAAMEAQGKQLTDEQLPDVLSGKEVFKTLIFARTLVKDICVSPRIGVVGQDPASVELAPEEIDIEDFEFLVKWGMSHIGGEEAAKARNFRGKPNLASMARPNSQKQRAAGK